MPLPSQASSVPILSRIYPDIWYRCEEHGSLAALVAPHRPVHPSASYDGRRRVLWHWCRERSQKPPELGRSHLAFQETLKYRVRAILERRPDKFHSRATKDYPIQLEWDSRQGYEMLASHPRPGVSTVYSVDRITPIEGSYL